jgi:hypothetical protein
VQFLWADDREVPLIAAYHKDAAGELLSMRREASGCCFSCWYTITTEPVLADSPAWYECGLACACTVNDLQSQPVASLKVQQLECRA